MPGTDSAVNAQISAGSSFLHPSCKSWGGGGGGSFKDKPVLPSLPASGKTVECSTDSS